VNPTAGRGRLQRLLPALRAAFARLPLDIEIVVTTSAADACDRARECFADGGGVVGVGGDGTVRDLADVAVTARGTLAIVPLGSGNDFARHLGFDHRDPLRALDALVDGTPICVDLGLARAADGTSRRFTTVANTGFDAEANRWANTVSWTSGATLYLLAVLRTVATYRPRPVRVVVDGHQWEGRVWLVAVGNARCYGGGMHITPEAELDDGLLDVCVIGDIGVVEFVANFPKVYRGTHTSHHAVTMLRGARVEIAAVDRSDKSPPAELWASGERVGLLPAVIETEAAALRVVVPATRP